MSKDEMPHEGHEKHLCYLHGEGLLKENIEEWKKLVLNGQYFCGGCGRVANSSKIFVILKSFNANPRRPVLYSRSMHLKPPTIWLLKFEIAEYGYHC